MKPLILTTLFFLYFIHPIMSQTEIKIYPNGAPEGLLTDEPENNDNPFF